MPSEEKSCSALFGWNDLEITDLISSIQISIRNTQQALLSEHPDSAKTEPPITANTCRLS